MLSTGCGEMSTWPTATLEKGVFNLENANIKESPSPSGTKQGPPLPPTLGSSPDWDRSWSKGASDKETMSLHSASNTLSDAPASHPAFPGSQAPRFLGATFDLRAHRKESARESPGSLPWNVPFLEHTMKSSFPTLGLEHKDPLMTWTRRCPCGQRATCRAAVTPERELRLLRMQSWSWWVCDLLALSRVPICGPLGGARMDSLRAFGAMTSPESSSFAGAAW